MKLSNKKEIGVEEAIDVLVSAGNERKRVIYALKDQELQFQKYLHNKQVAEQIPLLKVSTYRKNNSWDEIQVIDPAGLAKVALYYGLKLTHELEGMLDDYERPDPDLAGYMDSAPIQHLIATIRQLDNEDGTTIQGSTGWAIVAESYPDWPERDRKDLVRIAHRILTDPIG